MDVGLGEVDLADELGGIGGAVFTVHAAIFPFNRKGTLIADDVQFADDAFKVNTAVAGAAEVPASAHLIEVQV